MDKFLQKVITTIIEKTGVEPGEITESSYFEDDLNISEIELMEIIGTLEEEYQIELEDEEKENIESVMDLVELIVEKAE